MTKAVHHPVCERAGIKFRMEGLVGDYLRQVTEHWLKLAPAGNPAMIEMLRDRDRLPLRKMVPWAGEFAGKYLTGAVECLRLTGDRGLEAVTRQVVDELLACQDTDGYLGPWPRESRLTNRASNQSETWDAWGHYHVMMGLLLWHEDKHDSRALRAARGIGDAICRRYLGDATPRLVETGSTEMNLAPAHSLALLFRKTGEPRYLAMAKQIVREFAARGPDGTCLAGDWLEGTLAGLEFWQLPKPRWESLHPIMALAELYYLAGDARCREAFVKLWESMRIGDRHNNGGWSAGEQAQGNPYSPGAIETCCTIAWTALTVEMLRLTGRPDMADELEMTTFNSGLGLHSPSGKWATYNTPMDGVREASHHKIVFQAQAGQPDLNCCSVNAARSLGLIGAWAVMSDAEGYLLNAYGPGEIAADSARHGPLKIVQETRYPLDGLVRLNVVAASGRETTLKLRIPAWSEKTVVRLNGRLVPVPVPGVYLPLRRAWRKSDRLEIRFDMSVHAWMGEKECSGKTALYRGPLLLTWDRRYNPTDPDHIPALDGRSLDWKKSGWKAWLPPALLLETTACTGEKVRLCDFASAGNGGTPYRSWLPVEHADRIRSSPYRIRAKKDGGEGGI